MLALALIGWSGAALPLRAAGVFMVTTNSDAGPGSLRQAVADANTAGGGTILFSNVTSTITLAGSELVLSSNLMIIGPGPTNLAVSGGNVGSRVFKINAGSTSSISGLTIMNGRTAEGIGGGGIYNAGLLMLSNCVISGNIFTTSSFANGGGFGGGGIRNQGTLTLSDCMVLNNIARTLSAEVPCWGGGIYNLGELKAINSSFIGNATLPVTSPSPGITSPPPHGGGIYNSGTLLLSRSTLSANVSGQGSASDVAGGHGGSGGGLYNAFVATLVGCTVNSNRSGSGGGGGGGGGDQAFAGGHGGAGGGIYNGGIIYVTNCTIHGNATGAGGRGGNVPAPPPLRTTGNGGNGGDGAGICNTGTLAMASGTVSAGSTGAAGSAGTGSSSLGTPGTTGRGGGIWNQGGSVQLLNSIIAGNIATNGVPDVGGSFVSLGHNLIGVTNGSTGFPATGDVLNLDAKLGPLAANGGPTLTCHLLPGSPALDAGDSTLTGTDQRGLPRPAGAGVDIGAFETQPPSGPPRLEGLLRLTNGGFRFTFTNTPGATFTVLASTNVALPSTNWTTLGPAVENVPGWFKFTESTTTNVARRFYQIRWL